MFIIIGKICDDFDIKKSVILERQFITDFLSILYHCIVEFIY